MSNFKPYREGSRTNWGANQDAHLSIEQINCGALLRIADATELMAQRHTELITQRDMYLRWYQDEQKRRLLADRQISALKGVITKLKKARKS